MRKILSSLLAVLAVVATMSVATPTAFAQPHGARPDRQRHEGGGGRLSGEERQRLREDLQRQQAAPHRGGDQAAGDERARRYAEWQRLSPEQREGIRRDMRDANREFDRR